MIKVKNRMFNKVSSIFLLYSTAFTVSSILVLGVVFSYMQIKDFERSSEREKNEFIRKQQEIIKFETQKAVDYIQLNRMFVEENLQEELIKKVNSAWNICNNLYEENKAIESKQLIKKHIKDALRPIRFFNDRGYYFIVSMDGTEELYPVAPQFEGKNLINLQDEKGNYVIRQEIETIQKYGEGFVSDYWTKPGSESGMVFAKTSFIKYFEPLNWYIGCGEYLDNFTLDVKEKVLQRISTMRFGENGYIFINTYDGIALLMDGEVKKDKVSVWELEDPSGVKVIQEERKAVENPEGDFIYYSWRKLNTDEVFPKMSFIKGIQEWEWMVGAGVYIDEIDADIEKSRAELHKSLQRRVYVAAAVLVFVIAIVFFIAKRVSLRIHNNFESFTDKLTKAVESGEMLNENDFSIHDIKNTIESINGIIYNKIIAERLLKENEIRFRTLFENVPVYIAVIDSNFNIRLSNNEMKSFSSTIEHNIVNKLNLLELLSELENSIDTKQHLQKFNGDFKEYKLQTFNGIRTQNWTTYKTELDEYIGVGYDISELKDSQQKLKDLNETKDKFFSVVSHDLHAPFNSIIGFSDILLKRFDNLDKEIQIKYITQIHRSSLGMHQLLMNLLQWARSQSGKIKVLNSKVEIKQVINDILGILNLQAENKALKLINNTADELIAFTDKSMIYTIFQNLIANSIKFTKEDGLIEINAETRKDKIILSVKDNGIGIPKENIYKIFTLNSAKNKQGTNKETGTGLGLTVCKEFIDKMGEKIWVESTEGKGTTFFFTVNKA